MVRIKIKKGLDLPIKGAPVQAISGEKTAEQVAILGADYPGLKPQFNVEVNDRVRQGQVLFTAKSDERIRFTAPASGTVVAINRGEKRSFVSLVIQVSAEPGTTFRSFGAGELVTLPRKEVVNLLLESGLWTALRTRPFGKIPSPDSQPYALFITAMDTNPLAPDLAAILKGQEEAFRNGLKVLSRLTVGNLYLCKAPDSAIPTIDLPNLKIAEFAGPHPAGNVGTHIHFLAPVSRNRTVWYLNAQDVVAIGRLFVSGELDVQRIIALTGPAVQKPRLIRSRLGARVSDLVADEIVAGDNRLIAGSVLNGHTAIGAEDYLGRYQQQITVIPEGRQREFLGWLKPGWDTFSVKRIALSRIFNRSQVPFTTALNGSPRAIVPIGVYESVMPLNILPTYLLRALAVAEIEESEQLGCLELEEEDLALCTFVCPSKIDHGANLRRVLNLIEKEG